MPIGAATSAPIIYSSVKCLVSMQIVSPFRLPHGTHDFRSRMCIRFRYWEGLADIAALTAALDIIRGAWLASTGQTNAEFRSTHGVTGRKRDRDNGYVGGNAVGVSSHEDGNPLDPVVDKKDAPTASVEGVPTASQGQVTHGEEQSSSNTARIAAVIQETVPPDGSGLSGAANSQSGDTKTIGPSTPASITPKISSSLPEDIPVPGSAPSKRSSPVWVLGYAVELDSLSQKASVALVAEWPGIGSLHNLLEGKIQVAHGTFQEDLLRWTRQIAEGLMQMSIGCGGCDGGATLRISTRNAYLFPRPSNEFQGGDVVLDVRVRLTRMATAVVRAKDKFITKYQAAVKRGILSHMCKRYSVGWKPTRVEPCLKQVSIIQQQPTYTFSRHECSTIP